MKYIAIDLEGRNEPIDFTNNIIGNYLAESFLGSFNAQRSPFPDNTVISQIEKILQTYASKCIDVVDKLVDNLLFWNIYFDGSIGNAGPANIQVITPV